MSDEEIPMYCCLVFSCAVHFGFISVDTGRIECLVQLKSSQSQSEKVEIETRLREELHITNIHSDNFHLIYCPWCGTYLPNVIDYDKGHHAGQYSRKEGWER
jgi:hypothetical protein